MKDCWPSTHTHIYTLVLYIYIYIYIYIYAHTHTHTHTLVLYIYICTHTHTHTHTCPVGKVFANCLGDQGSIPGWVIPKTQKMILDTLSNIKYISRVKWSDPEKGVVPFPTPQCSSYWKGSLQVSLD